MAHRSLLLPPLLSTLALVAGLPIGVARVARTPIQPVAAESPQGDALPENGDFEDPVVTRVTPRYAGEVFGGWTVESGSVDQVHESYWVPPSGHQSLDLTGYCDAGAIYRDIPTTPGQSYLLRFALAGNPVGGARVVQAEIWWGADLVGTVSFNTSGRTTSSMGWTYRDYTVMAVGSSTRLKFKSLTSGCYGPAIDAVTLSPSPTPFSIQLPVEPSGLLDDGLGRLTAYFDHQYPIYTQEPKEPAVISSSILRFSGGPANPGVLGGDCDGEGKACYSGHSGYDFAFGVVGGTPVLAAAAGERVHSGSDSLCGHFVEVDHGRYQTRYCHLRNDDSLVTSGHVQAGDPIGTVCDPRQEKKGECGKSDGPHLHFEVLFDKDGDGRFEWPDELVDPYGWSPGLCHTVPGANDPWATQGGASVWLWAYSRPSCSTISVGFPTIVTTLFGIVARIPDGALGTAGTFRVNLSAGPSGGGPSPMIPQADGFPSIPVGRMFDLAALDPEEIEIGAFALPVEVDATYTDEEAQFVDEGSIVMYRWDVLGGTWVALPTVLDLGENRAAASTTQPGLFGLRATSLNPAPSLVAVTPAVILPGNPMSVVITGTGFFGTPFVVLGTGSLVADTATSDTLTITIPGGLAPGHYALTVINPDGQKATLADAISILAGVYIPLVLR